MHDNPACTRRQRRPPVRLLLSLALAAASEALSAFDAGSENRSGLTFSPDGQTAFWVEWEGEWGARESSPRIIYLSRQHAGRWSEPAPAPFSGSYSDDDPYVSPDGQWLYFVSKRPADPADESLDADLWRYSLAGDDRLERLAVSSDSAEYSPVVTSSGALYFASARDGDQGDLYRAEPLEDGFGAAVALGPAVNSRTGEWNLWVSADERELIFEASSRPGNVSISGDLYYSWRTPAGWTAAVAIDGLNSAGSELLPRLHPDGETLYYTTAAPGGHASIRTASWPRLRERLRAAYAPTLLVANRSSHEVTFVDLSRGEIVARIPTGEGPHLLSNLSSGRVLATGYGLFPRPHERPVTRRPPFVASLNSRLTLIDASDRTVLRDFVIEDCARPHASWIIAERAYVTCENERQVLAIDLTNGAPLGRFDTRQDGSHVLTFAPRSGTLAVSNTESGSVTLIDVAGGDTRIVDLAAGSEGSIVVDDRIWVANAFANSVSVVDPRAAAVVRQIDSVCGFPIAFSQGADRQVWLACFASAELVSIDRETFAVQRRIELEDQPLHVLRHPDRELAYVSLPRQNAIAEIDLLAGRELRRIGVGIEPDGLRWAVE